MIDPITIPGKWVEFVEAGHTGKTVICNVVAKEGGAVLGQIKWFGRWRRYAFFPHSDTIYEVTCLTDIAAFLNALMAVRKAARQATAEEARR